MGSGGLFGNNNNNNNTTQSSTTGGLFGNSANTNNVLNSGFGNNNNNVNNLQGQGNPQSYKLVATIDQNPYGNNLIFNNGSAVQQNLPASIGPIATPINVAEPKKPQLFSVYKLTPKPLFIASKESKNGSTSESPKLIQNNTIEKIVINENNKNKIFNSISDDAILASEIFTPRKNYKHLTINKTTKNESQEAKVIDFSKSVENGDASSSDSSNHNIFSDNSKENKDAREVKESKVEKAEKKAVNGDNVEVNEEGYWMKPSLEELENMSLLELRKVKNFTVGRKGFGKIEFLEPVDLTTISNLSKICGEIIIFIYQSCIVYPNETIKPEKGEGLNVSCEILLHKCYPISKSDKKPIVDSNHELVKRHIRKLQSIKNTKFISYDAKSGDWKFTVESIC